MNRPKPYGVLWTVAGKRKSKFFAKEADRDKEYNGLVRDALKGGLDQNLSRSEVAEYRAMKSTFGSADWREIWRVYLGQVGAKALSPLTVAGACKLYLEREEGRFALGKLAADTMRHKRTKIQRFADAFGSNQLAAIEKSQVEKWIEFDLGYDVGDTFDGWIRHLRALFAHFVTEKKIRENPLLRVERRGNAIEYVNILSVRDTARLFAHAMEHQRVAIGRLALEAFVGLRFGSATRLEKSDINFVDKGITLPAFKLKTGKVDGRSHFIDELPSNLWDWLKIATPDAWTLSGSDWMHLKSDLFNEAHVPHPRNCLRHSFCTYHMALHKNPGRTATILCHRNQEQLWGHYKGNASSEFGKRYFQITPKTAAKIALEEVVQQMPGRRQTAPVPGTESGADAPSP